MVRSAVGSRSVTSVNEAQWLIPGMGYILLGLVRTWAWGGLGSGLGLLESPLGLGFATLLNYNKVVSRVVRPLGSLQLILQPISFSYRL